jgi:hypothetical protein
MKWDSADIEPPRALEPGKAYAATVMDAEERVSKNGNPYIDLKIAVYVTPDKPVTQYTNVMVAFPPKLRAFCLSAGLFRQYAAQELHFSDCCNKSCCVIIGKKKNDNGFYEIETFEVPADAEARLKAARDELATVSGAQQVPFA